jgi:hypothetical protein
MLKSQIIFVPQQKYALDCDRNRIRVGDLVRIIGGPDPWNEVGSAVILSGFFQHRDGTGFYYGNEFHNSLAKNFRKIVDPIEIAQYYLEM